jgi:hypothetical protein
MYAFSIAVAKAGVELDLPKNPKGIMVQVSRQWHSSGPVLKCIDGHLRSCFEHFLLQT